jgi:hypothetical protein
MNAPIAVANSRLANLFDALFEGSLSGTTRLVVVGGRIDPHGTPAGSTHPSRRASHQRVCASGQASKLSAECLLKHLFVEAPPRPVPLHHRANRAQMKPGLSSAADSAELFVVHDGLGAQLMRHSLLAKGGHLISSFLIFCHRFPPEPHNPRFMDALRAHRSEASCRF